MMQRYFPCHLQVTLLNVQPLLHLCKMDSPHTDNRPLSCKALGQVFLFVSPGVVIIQKPKQIGAGKASVVHSSMRQIPPHLKNSQKVPLRTAAWPCLLRAENPVTETVAKGELRFRKPLEN